MALPDKRRIRVAILVGANAPAVSDEVALADGNNPSTVLNFHLDPPRVVSIHKDYVSSLCMNVPNFVSGRIYILRTVIRGYSPVIYICLCPSTSLRLIAHLS